MTRSREQQESLSLERDKLSSDQQRAVETQRRHERQTRDAREEYDDVERKQSEASQRNFTLVSTLKDSK